MGSDVNYYKVSNWFFQLYARQSGFQVGQEVVNEFLPKMLLGRNLTVTYG